MASHDEYYHFVNHSSILSPHSEKSTPFFSSPTYSSSFSSCIPYSKEFPAYKFIKTLQSGSYGNVILAKDLTTNTKVALKVLSKDSDQFMARHELSILKKLQSNPHKNICKLLDHFQTENYHWFSFEYCSNGDLYDYIANGNNDSKPLHFKTLLKELVQVINFTHSKGIYHRDIKAENILLDSSKSIKLTDWGLSTTSIISDEPCVGTEKYMAPESFFKQKKRSKKTISYNTKTADYWSLGITLLYILFKRCPWKLANLSDPNFAQFAQDPYILFNWYPKLSDFGFDCILSLLQLNPIHRSLDRFYEKAIVYGYKESFTLEDPIPTYSSLSSSIEDDYYTIGQTRVSNIEEDPSELLFGMDIEDTASSPVTKQDPVIDSNKSKPEILFKEEGEDNNSFMDQFFDETSAIETDSFYDEILTPMTNSLQTTNSSIGLCTPNSSIGNNSLEGLKTPISTIRLKMKTLSIDNDDNNPGDKHHHHTDQLNQFRSGHCGNVNSLFATSYGDDMRSQYRELDTLGW